MCLRGGRVGCALIYLMISLKVPSYLPDTDSIHKD